MKAKNNLPHDLAYIDLLGGGCTSEREEGVGSVDDRVLFPFQELEIVGHLLIIFINI